MHYHAYVFNITVTICEEASFQPSIILQISKHCHHAAVVMMMSLSRLLMTNNACLHVSMLSPSAARHSPHGSIPHPCWEHVKEVSGTDEEQISTVTDSEEGSIGDQQLQVDDDIADSKRHRGGHDQLDNNLSSFPPVSQYEDVVTKEDVSSEVHNGRPLYFSI